MSETSQPGEPDQDQSKQGPDEIAAEIEATRARLADSVDALTDKLDVKAQAKEKVQDAKADVRAKVRSTTEDVKAKVRSTTEDVKAKVRGTTGSVQTKLARPQQDDPATLVNRTQVPTEGATGVPGQRAGLQGGADRLVAGSRSLLDRFLTAPLPVQAAVVAVPVALLTTVIVRRARS